MIKMTGMIKKVLVLSTIYFVLSTSSAQAEDVQTCTQVTQYGGAVGYICGASTHTPVNTGIADNLPLIASGFLSASGFLAYLSKKFGKQY